MAFGRIFKELAMNMVQAFTTRAKEVYSAANIVVEVAYALPEKQYLQSVKLEERDGRAGDRGQRSSGAA
jgi:hypothetical protein